MALINPYILSNRGGIPRLRATGVTVNTNNVSYAFRFRPFLNGNYSGLIIFDLPTFTAPATAVPLVFTSLNGGDINVLDRAGTAVTSADTTLLAGGIFLAYFENGNLRLLF